MSKEVDVLRAAIGGGELIVSTGMVLQELLQGFHGPKDSKQLLDRFRDIPLITPGRDTHIEAAALRNRCRRMGVQAGTIDALIARICVENELELLSADQDFLHMARCVPLKLR
jgi:predicted nucleic acid-binding protein